MQITKNLCEGDALPNKLRILFLFDFGKCKYLNSLFLIKKVEEWQK